MCVEDSFSKLRSGFKIGDFIFVHAVGTGAFATVWKARHEITSNSVAIKVVKKSAVSSSLAKTRLQREISLLKRFDHPFIADFFQEIEDEDNIYLVMEHVDNGNLLDYVNGSGRLSENLARRYFIQLISALEYLHKDKKVAHRDLKCENVMLDKYHNIRLIDFGLSNIFTDTNPELKTACGSPAYAAPEMIQGQSYTIAADIWSAGILLYSIIVGRLPYDDDNVNRLLQKIVYTEVFYPSFLSAQLEDLLQKMLCKDPRERITLDKIKTHPWFSQSEYESLLIYTQSEMFKMQFELIRDGQSTDPVIAKEIIDKMSSYGVECHGLHQSLLLGEYTDKTALYKILYRENLTEKLKDAMLKMINKSNQYNVSGKLQTQPLIRFKMKQVFKIPENMKNEQNNTNVNGSGMKQPNLLGLTRTHSHNHNANIANQVMSETESKNNNNTTTNYTAVVNNLDLNKVKENEKAQSQLSSNSSNTNVNGNGNGADPNSPRRQKNLRCLRCPPMSMMNQTGQARILGAPVKQTSNRRLSRPVAFRKSLAMPTHEEKTIKPNLNLIPTGF
ncbi:CAMK family protein kinase [Tritrichomonas foetus]|uniref:non-specific serine/threonine protein kinase n=1 Tax=Tritrichomonas foetus TaxID=1144522 RepID=A0A1J4KQM0_9EUKA|nr:CAMK family protein kinase [Tritrichomonas foetus]|eukprot:OHT11749.1 CAMK family protein kinase [Tritrichomonas foetus]